LTIKSIYIFHLKNVSRVIWWDKREIEIERKGRVWVSEWVRESDEDSAVKCIDSK
jgi:hypothetical protein